MSDWYLPSGAHAHDALPRFDDASAHALLASLREARPVALLSMGATERARRLGRAGARFLDPRDPLRLEADARVPASAGLSPAMARAVIAGMARDWTAARLLDLLAADLPDAGVLEDFVPGAHGRRVRAFAPALSLHVGSGTVPGVSATSMLRALLVGSAVLLKPGAGDVALAVLLARAIAEEAPELASACAVVHWPGGSGDALEAAALRETDLVVVYGGDEAVRAVRERVPVATPVVAYHHRVSAAVVGRAALTRASVGAVADALARAVALFDQRGCVSPHVAFVEEDGEVAPAALASALAAALTRLDGDLPPGPVAPHDAAAVQQLRLTAQLRAASGEAVSVHAGSGASWTVLMEPAGELELSCLGRTVRLHPVADARAVPRLLAPWGRHLQTIGASGLGERLPALAAELGAVGAVRVCRLEDVPFPPPWWHHDGRGPLTALLRWVDLES